MRTLPRPAALLLDFGGVLYSSLRRPSWRQEIVDEIEACLRRAHCAVPDRELLERDIKVARVAESSWKTAASRTGHPTEIMGETFWGEFVASDWPPAARAALVASSLGLSRALVESMADYEVRPGTRALLEEAARQGIPVAVVSNTRSGDAFRELLRRDQLSELIAVEVYSDEVGIRKPNPEMLRLAAGSLGLQAGQCWYGGDHYDRDVMCARRAGIGVAVLVHDQKTLSPAYPAQAQPDLEVQTPAELAAILADGARFAREDSRRDSAPERSTHAARPRTDRPAALLLDHGGVIAYSRKDPLARLAFAGRVVEYLRGTGWEEFDAESVAKDIEEAHRQHALRKGDPDTESIPEVSHLEFWRDLVAATWADHPKAAVTARSTPLMIEHIATRSDRSLRPGILDLLARCADIGIPVGIVSNTLCGAAVRMLSYEWGTAPYLSVEIYSDELGFRKPDPITIETAALALGVHPADCWYVGDKPERDMACARRAGVGRAVLMKRASEPAVELNADLVVHDAAELLLHLDAALSNPSEPWR